MYTTLITIVILLFVGMLFLNIYFRVKVMKSYKYLVQNEVDMGTVHFFDTKRMESEILPKYPEHADEIQYFVGNIRKSIRMGTVLLSLITVFGGILMYYRHDY
ncbi:MAG: hypothetical protein ACPG5P_00380 [Saprospiraceae bacterium]